MFSSSLSLNKETAVPTVHGTSAMSLSSDSDDNKDIYCPENDSDSYGSDSETELDATQMNFHENDTEIQKQPKFIVFQNQLLLLLSICLACFSKEVDVNHILKGSMLTAYIKCLCCKTVREWKSQPEIRNFEAGDIILTLSHLGDLIHSQPGGGRISPPSVSLLSLTQIKPNLVC